MTTNIRLTGFVLPFLAFMSFALNAETINPEKTATIIDPNKNSETSEKKVIKQKTGGFSYIPPKRGAPAVRIGGGTRGTDKQTLELVVFAPDHAGLTTKAQPKLYWYVSKPVLSKLEVTLINDKHSEPVFEKVIETPSTAGIQSIDLAKMAITLKPDLKYRWFVSVISNKNQRSNDVVASGVIKRVVPDLKLKRELSVSNQFTMIDIYAQNGIWFDAVDTLMQMVDKHPENTDLLNKRIALLKQVGLHSAADFMQKHD